MSEYYDELEIRDPEQRQQALIRAVAAQVAHAKERAPAYRERLAQVDPAAIDSAAAIARLPLTRKSELLEEQRRNPPLGGFCAVSGPELAWLFASPGPIYEPGTRRPDFWRFARALFAAGFRRGDLIHNCFSYHLTPAGAMIDSGGHALGCTLIPAGVGQTELQVQTIADLRPNGYVGTPSFLKIILEKADELGTGIGSLTRALVSGEALPPSLREEFLHRGIRCRQCYATADVGVIAYESEAEEGLIVDEGVYLEIVRPGTNEPVPDGEVGEVVVTSLNPDYPLIRFATGDLSAILPGTSPCGRSNRRIRGWMGRADQTAKVRGMFVHPHQIARIVARHDEVVRARLVIDWVDQRDEMVLQCEVEQPSEALAEAVAGTIRDVCKVRGAVEFVVIGTLPNDGRVIDDIRRYD
ncbi:MAG TPA: phenylacetate--CoA ligase family protein [Sedimenticola thiotaurini]|uniref:Phenylacetate--CoA ligase family protein n=1 Tax=Sedimenticola thiotaurini TaxID=1543721 RepID=A0A831RJ12_9GAMM|nr:phenylacetate--CoA ligase family protein [Sedimenticola thiotaurini]